MNAASLLESFPKTKTKRFKVTMPSSWVVSQLVSYLWGWNTQNTLTEIFFHLSAGTGETPEAESFPEPWSSPLCLHVGGQPLCQVSIPAMWGIWEKRIARGAETLIMSFSISTHEHIIVALFVLWSVVVKSILSFDHLVSSRVAWIEKVNLAILCPFCNSFALLLHHFLPIVHHFCIIFTSFVGADEKHFRELQHINVPVMLMPDDFRAFSKIKIDNHAFNKENLPSHFKVGKCVNLQ